MSRVLLRALALRAGAPLAEALSCEKVFLNKMHLKTKTSSAYPTFSAVTESRYIGVLVPPRFQSQIKLLLLLLLLLLLPLREENEERDPHHSTAMRAPDGALHYQTAYEFQ
jgi:hypothetical protein